MTRDGGAPGRPVAPPFAIPQRFHGQTDRMMMAVCAILLVNALTAHLFALDKRRARAGEWRVREDTLLTLAFFGGSPAAVWALHRLRHKTCKQPFSTWLDLIAMLHAGIAIGLVATFA